MSSQFTDLDNIFAQPHPEFLELLKTDPETALQQFVKYARPWLMKHPTPAMRTLGVDERRAVVRETVDRCVRDGGEWLLGYTADGGTFGAWLSGVAEAICTEKSETPGTVPAERSGSIAASKPAERFTPPGEKPSRAVLAFFHWVRTPWVFLPILLVTIILFILGVRNHRRTGPATYVDRSLPVAAALVDSGEADNAYFDTMPVTLIAGDDHPETRPAETTIFRESRIVVLRLDHRLEGDNIVPSGIRILNAAGETVWRTAIGPELLGGESFFVRLEPRTFPPDDYEIHVVDAVDNVIATASIMFR